MDTMPSQAPQQPAPSMPPTISSSSEAPQKSKVIGVVTIIIILIALAFLAYTRRDIFLSQEEWGDPSLNAGRPDSVSAIDKDLQATDVTHLDTELGDIDSTLNASKK